MANVVRVLVNTQRRRTRLNQYGAGRIGLRPVAIFTPLTKAATGRRPVGLAPDLNMAPSLGRNHAIVFQPPGSATLPKIDFLFPQKPAGFLTDGGAGKKTALKDRRGQQYGR